MSEYNIFKENKNNLIETNLVATYIFHLLIDFLECKFHVGEGMMEKWQVFCRMNQYNQQEHYPSPMSIVLTFGELGQHQYTSN